MTRSVEAWWETTRAKLLDAANVPADDPRRLRQDVRDLADDAKKRPDSKPCAAIPCPPITTLTHSGNTPTMDEEPTKETLTAAMRMAEGMMAMIEQTAIVREGTARYRDELLAKEFSQAAAEAMTLEFHKVLVAALFANINK